MAGNSCHAQSNFNSNHKSLPVIVFAFWHPKEIVIDNGSQFVSQEFTQFLKVLGVKHTPVTTYHPQSNGEAERMVRTIKENIKAFGQNWKKYIPDMLLAYRTSKHGTTGNCRPNFYMAEN